MVKKNKATEVKNQEFSLTYIIVLLTIATLINSLYNIISDIFYSDNFIVIGFGLGLITIISIIIYLVFFIFNCVKIQIFNKIEEKEKIIFLKRIKFIAIIGISLMLICIFKGVYNLFLN